MRVIQPFRSKQFLIFLLTGGGAAVVNFGARIFYNRWFSFSVSIVLAYLVGMVVAFILAKLFVFQKSQQALHRSILLFVLVNLVGMLQTWLVSMGCVFFVLPRLGMVRNVPEIAHFVGIMTTALTGYIGHKHWSFRV